MEMANTDAACKLLASNLGEILGQYIAIAIHGHSSLVQIPRVPCHNTAKRHYIQQDVI